MQYLPYYLVDKSHFYDCLPKIIPVLKKSENMILRSPKKSYMIMFAWFLQSRLNEFKLAIGSKYQQGRKLQRDSMTVQDIPAHMSHPSYHLSFHFTF